MGGTAFGFEGKRLNREQFFGLWKETIEPGLTQLVKEGVIKEYYLLQAFKDKTDFGDMDVLIKGTLTPAVVMDIFGVELTKANGKVVSFMYDGFQIDLIRISKETYWESAVAYYSHGDLGMLVGKIARFLGMRWGWKGLTYPVYNNVVTRERKLGEIEITHDPKKAFEFLGFDSTRIFEQFNTATEMYEYVIRSRYFTRQPFLPENLNARQRIRDARRPSYQDFLKYLERLPELPEIPRPTDAETLRRADKFFEQDFSAQVLELLQNDQVLQVAKRKFSGHTVMEMYGMEGRQLGRAMSIWNDHFSNGLEQARFILTTPFEKVVEEFEGVTGVRLGNGR